MKNFICILITFILTGCITAQKPPVNPDPYAGLQFDLTYSNGLTNEDRMQYYYMDEGIQYLPVDVLLSLDRPVEDGLGLYDERILARPERFGLYPNPINKNLIPIGITVSQDSSYVKMGGINCATCHFSIISYKGKAFLVDGGSGLFAIDRLIKEMVFSIASTVASPSEFGKFYDRYKARTHIVESDKDKKALIVLMQSSAYSELSTAVNAHLQGKNKRVHKDLTAYLMTRKTTLSQAYPTSNDLNSGVKMFEYLVKRLLFFAEQGQYASTPDGSKVSESGLGRSNPWSVVKNMLAKHLANKDSDEFPKVPGGPINTPNIWGFDQSKWIFWTGVTNSMLERNIAQGVALVTDYNWDTYETTISIKKLAAVSALAKKIIPPAWPEAILGKIDTVKAEQGKLLFKQHCLSCHAEPKQWEQGTATFSSKYVDVGTDPEYYKGQVEPFYGKDLFKDVLAPWLKKIKTFAYKREKISNPFKYEEGRMDVVWRAPSGNKPEAKPLWGIWASPPYLHNGSVPSIRELLKKPGERVTDFYVGSTEYNPDDLGFDTKNVLYFSSHLQVNCSQCVGNSNQGHEFGTDLDEDEKNQLIEFLKSYTPATKF